MTREEAFNKKALMLSTQLNFDRVLNKIYDDFEQQIQKLQEENEHLKNILQAHTKEKK